MSFKERIKSKNFFGKVFPLILLASSIVNAADMDTPYNKGIGAADQTRSVLTSGKRDKLYAPLTSDTPMTTLDGSKSGKVKFGCKDATTFRLDFYFVPKGNNTYGLVVKKGDGTLLLNTDSVVYQDYAGSSVTHTGVAISGVCDNGIVYCKGAWNSQNCYYFQYVADSKGNLSLSQVWLKDSSSKDLGQCSCTDASCGWVNIVPYSYVVGGIANALMSANPKYQMSSGNWDSSQFKYTYYGTDNSNCTSASGNPYSPGDDNPSRFYSPNGGDVDHGTVDSVIAQQSSNDKSPYSVATKLQTVQYNKNGTTVQVSKPDFPYCFVSNDVGIQQDVVNPVVGGCKLKSTHLYWPYYYSGACSFSISCNSDGTVCYGDRQGCDGCGEWITVTVDGTRINVKGETHGEGCDWYDFKSVTLDQCGSVTVPLPGVSTNAYIDTEPIYTCPSGYTMVGSSCKRDRAVLVSNDGCASYENNSECHVYNKWICNRGETNPQNCTNVGFSSSDFQHPANQMVRNSAKISDGKTYPVQCYNTSTDVAAYQICESPTSALVYRTTQVLASDGSAALSYVANSPASAASIGNGSFSVLDGRFTTLYQYQCNTSTSMDIERSKATMASLNMNGNAATFNDPAHPGTRTINTPKFSSCLDTFCLVKTSCSTTEVNADSTNKAQTQGGTTVLYDKRKCTRNSNLKYDDNTTPSFTCPVNAGETILANCDCEENIDALTNHTISVLEAVDQMVKDWICSSN